MIGLEKVTAGYGDKTVLHDVTLALAETGITALTGPSGEGKTTILRLLAGLERPWSGRVYAAKVPAVLFQENRLFPHRTVEQHLRDVLPADRWEEVTGWLELAGLTGEEKTLPAALSGGMARRLALVRAMALGGDCLLLDEPFTGIDPERKAVLLKRIQEWPVPVLLITHHAEETASAKKFISLSEKSYQNNYKESH